jgi:hypothetical protein
MPKAALPISILSLLLGPGALAMAPPPATSPAVLADPGAPGEMILALGGALGRGDAAPLIVHLESHDGRWTEVWAEALSFNVVLHYATVTEAQHQNDTTRLKIVVQLRDDFWVRGGQGEFSLQLRRRPATGPVRSGHLRLFTSVATHVIEGSHRGTVTIEGETKSVEGAVQGIVLPPRRPAPGFVPPPADEHPRLLVRKAEVPVLRERAARTPLGRAVVEQLKQLDHEVADAILYQLTGDPQWAKRAWDRVDVSIGAERSKKTKGYGGGETEHTADYVVGHQITTAYAWDLCWEAWTAEQRRQIVDWMEEMIRYNVYRPWTYSNTGSTGSIRTGCTLVMSGGATIGLNLWGLHSPPPPPPRISAMEERLRAQRPGWLPGPTPEERRKAWEDLHARWKAAGGMNLDHFDMARYARQALSVNINENIGEGGSTRHLPLMDWAIAYRNVLGADVTGRPELPTAAVDPMARTVAWAPSRQGPGEVPLGVGGDLGISPSVLARFLALSSDPIRSAVKAYWLRMVGLKYEDLQTDQGATQFMKRSFPAGGHSVEAAAPFYALQYMIEGPPPKPVDQVLPLVTEHLSRGTLFTRSGWGNDTILIETDACAHSVQTFGAGAGASAGNFNLWGFGIRWTTSRPGVRVGQNVVQIPAIWANPHSFGRITHLAQDEQARTTNLTVAADDSYKIREHVMRMRTETIRDGWITKTRQVPVRQVVTRDAGIHCTRSFAVDTSGRCGAPALLAVADRMTGPRPKVWALNVPGLGPPHNGTGGRPWTPSTKLDIDGNTFTLHEGSATLRATFVAPAGVRIARAEGNPVIDAPDVTASKHNPDWLRYGIEATAPDETSGDFLVVFTLQNGGAPAVKASGAGLDATVTIGSRTLRFDGQKFVLGQAPQP